MQSTPIITGDWRLCRALLLVMVTRCALLVTGDCTDCAEHYYYDWGLGTVQITPISTGYWRPVQSTPNITGH